MRLRQQLYLVVLVAIVSLYLSHFHFYSLVTSSNDEKSIKPAELLQEAQPLALCSALLDKAPHTTAAMIWRNNLERIENASQPPEDSAHHIHSPWIRQILSNLLLPRQLQRGLRWPASTGQWTAALQIVHKRMESPSIYPPLKVLVLGGSTAEGTGCHLVSKELLVMNATKGTTGRGRDCAWPNRLQLLCNHLLGRDDIVEIINLSVGGTHSGLAGPFLKYWLYPSAFQPHGPDVVINAYATNDAVPPAFHYGAAPYNTTQDHFHLSQVVRKRMDFQRHAQQSYCGPHSPILPLVVYVDDYLGNHQPVLLGDLQVADVTEHGPLVEQDRVAVVSSAEVVRPFVYGRVRESIFSPKWKIQELTQSQVHYGIAGHLTVAWVVAYATLQMTVDTCQDLLGSTAAQGRPIPSSTTTQPTCRGDKAPCIFAFLAAPLGTHSNAHDLNQYLQTATMRNTGWQAMDQLRDGGYQNKLGVIADSHNATLVLGWHHISQPVRTLTLHTLKSYSEKFQDSVLHGTLEVFYRQELLVTREFDILGFHNQTTSIAEPFSLDLGEPGADTGSKAIQEAPMGSSIRLRLQLIRGTTFQLNALMLCSH